MKTQKEAWNSNLSLPLFVHRLNRLVRLFFIWIFSERLKSADLFFKRSVFPLSPRSKHLSCLPSVEYTFTALNPYKSAGGDLSQATVNQEGAAGALTEGK